MKTDEKGGEPGRSRAGRAFALVFLPYLLAFLPFFFHHSEVPAVLGYSRKYALFLAGGVSGIAALALAAAVSARRRGRVHAAAGLVVMLASGLLTLAAGELALRIQHTRFMDPFWGQQASLFLGYENRPFHSWSNQYGFFQTDESGFRVHAADPAWRSRDHYRIFALGESSTFGLGLAETNTWTWRLEQRLREALGTEHLDVINAGNPGHNSLQIFLQFFFKVYPLRPNIVLLYLGKNDAVTRGIHAPTRLEIDPWKLMSYSKLDYVCRMNEGKSWYFRTLVSDFLRERAARWRARWARAAKGGQPPAPGGMAADEPPVFLVRNGRDFFMKHVAAIADGCRRLNAVFVPVTFAHALKDWDGQAVDYYNQLLREFAAREGWPLVDFAQLVAQQPDPASFFWDDHHPNEKGAALLADALFEVLRDRVSVSLRSPNPEP